MDKDGQIKHLGRIRILEIDQVMYTQLMYERSGPIEQ